MRPFLPAVLLVLATAIPGPAPTQTAPIPETIEASLQLAEAVLVVGRLLADPQRHDRNQGGDQVDRRLQRVGEEADGVGEQVGDALHEHRRQRGGDREPRELHQRRGRGHRRATLPAARPGPAPEPEASPRRWVACEP